MKNVLKSGAMVLAVAALSPAAFADSAETKGGLKVKTDDGRFEFGLGGRIHLDANVIDADDTGASAGAISNLFFRRARLTLSGKAYGWEYKFEQDFAGGAPSERDLYIATKVPGGKLMLGQFKAFRGMEESTSSNELTFMERPYVQANFPSQQFGIGAGYKGGVGNATYALGLQNRRVDGSAGTNDDVMGSGRFTFAPLNTSGSVLHLGLSGSVDNLNRNATGTDTVGVQYAGRTLGTLALSSPFVEGTFLGGELGAVFGPFYAQAEYMTGDLDLPGGGSEETVAYYVQTSVHVTGESKPYKGGVFKSVKPKGSIGAIELKARYDFAENKDIADNEVSSVTVGANWYVNPNVRFMLDYIMAEAKAGTSIGADEPNVLAARAQFNF